MQSAANASFPMRQLSIALHSALSVALLAFASCGGGGGSAPAPAVELREFVVGDWAGSAINPDLTSLPLFVRIRKVAGFDHEYLCEASFSGSPCFTLQIGYAATFDTDGVLFGLPQISASGLMLNANRIEGRFLVSEGDCDGAFGDFELSRITLPAALDLILPWSGG